ncbi:UNVERIFIED_CONTAM: hypothetical protein FKN15_033784 [Acipenser sinensis]
MGKGAALLLRRSQKTGGGWGRGELWHTTGANRLSLLFPTHNKTEKKTKTAVLSSGLRLAGAGDPTLDTTCSSDGWAVTSDQKKAEQKVAHFSTIRGPAVLGLTSTRKVYQKPELRFAWGRCQPYFAAGNSVAGAPEEGAAGYRERGWRRSGDQPHREPGGRKIALAGGAGLSMVSLATASRSADCLASHEPIEDCLASHEPIEDCLASHEPIEDCLASHEPIEDCLASHEPIEDCLASHEPIEDCLASHEPIEDCLASHEPIEASLPGPRL